MLGGMPRNVKKNECPSRSEPRGLWWSLRKHIHKGLQQLAPRKGQQERYRNNDAGDVRRSSVMPGGDQKRRALHQG